VKVAVRLPDDLLSAADVAAREAGMDRSLIAGTVP
jgi:hypothetical protein